MTACSNPAYLNTFPYRLDRLVLFFSKKSLHKHSGYRYKMDASFAIPSKSNLAADGTATVPSKRYGTSEDLPHAIDLSHHLNELAKHRQASSLKQLYKYAAVPGMITMAGGECS
jgi:hypothetical protein